MKFEDLKVGMKVKAIDNAYRVTNKSYQFEGEIIDINKKCKTFTAKTTHTTYPNKELRLYEWNDLKAKHFEPIEEKKIVTMNEIPLKVTYAHNTVYVIYKGKIVAKATCNQEDTFNEEFGLNLALRRFCKTLCDENTTKKVIYNTDKVEDFI